MTPSADLLKNFTPISLYKNKASKKSMSREMDIP